MKIRYTILILITLSCFLKAQMLPVNYHLMGEKNSLSKVTYSTPTSNTISDIITIGDTIWLGTSRGLSYSDCRGECWVNFYQTSPFGTDFVSALGYNDGVVWVATGTSEEFGGSSIAVGTGLKYTTNNGQYWHSFSQPVDNECATTIQYGINTLHALPVTVPQQNITYDMAFTPSTMWITSWAGGLRKTTDGGYTWERVVLPPDYLDSISPTDTLDFCLSVKSGDYCSEENRNHVAFSVIAINDSTLYVGTANGINRSTDGGTSWIKFNHQNQNEPISGNFITSLAYNYTTSTIWASTWIADDPNESYGVSSSDDGGKTWKTFLIDEKAHNFGFKAFDVIAATDNGAFRSTNQGNSWILPTSVVDTISDPISNLVLRTNTFNCAGSEGNTVWLGSDDGLAKLDETGLWEGTWKLYFASQRLKSGGETYAYPNPFSPRQEQLKIKYSTGGDDASVTIRIYDFGMNYVRTVIQNVTRNRDLDGPPDFWDGKDDAGNIVPNGVYLYRVDINSNDPLFGKIIVMQ